MKRNLILIGLMGAGKSTVGQEAARRLGLAFVDTDQMVEEEAGRSVAAIFEVEGEAGFRRLETEAIARACSQGGQVIATGGGAVLDPDNRRRLWDAGLVVWLDAPPAVLAERLPPSGDRPLLAGVERAARLSALLEQRRPLYALAHRRLDVVARTLDEAVEEVVSMYQSWPNGPRVVPVNLGERSYRIVIGPGGLARAGGLLREVLAKAGPRVLIVTTPPVAALWLDRLAESLRDAGFIVRDLVVPDGEESKSLEVLVQVYDACAEAGLDRGDLVAALGGGAVGDLAGLAAATYLRGIAFAQVPTTLLAQVDASVGGKVAVNHPRGKNLIGAFHQPRLVLADTATLATLPEREFRSGLAEVIKHGVVADPSYLDLTAGSLDAVLARDAEALAAVAEGSCRIKAAVVAADERESGLRANLNFGHTAGHGIEAAAGFGGLLHGEAVGLGMLVAARLSEARGWAPGLTTRLTDLLGRAGLPVRIPGLPLGLILDYMQTDKKASEGRLTWVLVPEVGRAERVRDVDLADAERILLDLGARG
ncbi:MAG: 3-dehydroquinate synthase [Bacillota bacterium]